MNGGLKREHLWPAEWNGLLRLAKSLGLNFYLMDGNKDTEENRFCVIEGIIKKLVDLEIEDFYKRSAKKQ